MPMSEDEKRQALQSLETDDERTAREAREKEDADKPRRGRPPGTTNKPKISDEALRAGCISLVKFLWLMSAVPAKLSNASLDPLTDEEVAEGAVQAEGLVKRYVWLVMLMTVVGFPLWWARMFAAKLHRKPQLASVSDMHTKPAAKA
jgi:hypothetical protein